MHFILKQRKKINKIDEKLIKLLEKRFKLVGDIKVWKKRNKIQMEDKKREEFIVNKFERRRLPKKFVNNFFNLLFKEAKK